MNQPDPTLSIAAAVDPHQTSPFQPPHEAERLGPNTFVGDYEILAEIAHGGMGVVYKARQGKLNRIVALKMTRAGDLASDQQNQRFKAEAEAAANLDHPHIVPIYEVGEFGGRHYFSMAFVEGRSLAQEVVASPLPPRHAAALMKQVADAVAYAHANGVIHRDLKPGNIMLGAAGQPRVTDFGLAKRADADSSLTQAGQVMGTPSYMPPEQAEGRNDQVGPLADVYSLGATLYCLLTGRPPFQAASVVETLKQVVEREPVAPHRLNPAVDRDLDTICLKCLEKRPEKRYPSATALAEDLQRYLDRRPILARPVGDVEKLVRWCRRNSLEAACLAGIVGIFVAAFALVSWSYVRAEDARKEEAKHRRAAEDKERAERWGRYRSNIAAASGALQLQNSGAARRALDDAPEEHRNWEWKYLHSQLDGASLVVPVPGGKVMSLVLSPSGQQVAVCAANQNEVYLYDVATGRLEAVLRGHSAPATSVEYRPDGKQIATSSNDQTIRLWDPATGQQTALLEAEVAPPNLDRNPLVAYNSDGSRIAAYAPEEGGGTSRLWDATTGKEIAVLGKWQEGTVPIAFSPDGKRVAVGSKEYVHLCDAVTGRPIAVLGPHAKRVVHLAYSPDGKRIASSTFIGSSAIHLWDGENGKEVAVLRDHTGDVNSVLFSPDGSRLVSGSKYPDNTARLWDAATGRPLKVLAGHKNEINSVAFSPDGKRVATASGDQTGRLWDGRTGQFLAVLGGHTDRVRHVLFSPDGTRVVTASDDATLRLWEAQTGEWIGVLRGHGDGFDPNCPPVFTPDGSRLVSGSTDGTVRIWDMGLVERNGILKGHESYVYDVAFSPNGEQVASAAWDGTARLWDATTGHPAGRPLKHETKIITSVAYSRDGRRIVTAERERGVTLWDVASQKPARDSRFFAPVFWDNRACLNPAGTLLASGSFEGPVRLWDVATGREVARLDGHHKESKDVTFHPEGSLLATAGEDGTVRLWDIATRATVAVLRGHTDIVYRVAFSADGKLLASCSDDKTIRLWDAQTHQPLGAISVGSIVYCVAFSPDGTRLAAGCRDNTVRLFDVACRQQVAELRGHTDYVHAVAWSPDGTRLVSGSGDHTVRIWDSLSAQERAKRAATK
jgi:eukaryotic-like serine/threonine-protein kinase